MIQAFNELTIEKKLSAKDCDFAAVTMQATDNLPPKYLELSLMLHRRRLLFL